MPHENSTSLVGVQSRSNSFVTNVTISFEILHASPPVSSSDILWHHTPAATNESIILDNSSHHLMLYNSSSFVLTLHIINASYNNRGRYLVHASNQAGNFVSSGINLDIQSQCSL